MFALALAEFRTLRRLPQTWVVVAVAVAAGFSPFVYYSVAHALRSGYGATVGSVPPKFLVHSFGGLLLGALFFGVVLLTLDAVARDRREGTATLLHSRPVNNLAPIFGKAAALTLTTWLAVPVLAAATFVFAIARAGGRWFGDFPEPASLAGFMFVDALPMLAFWTAAVMLLAVAVRSRILVAGFAFALLGLQCWALFAMPPHLLPVLSLLPRFGELASDILPRVVDAQGLGQRASVLALACGFLGLAAAAHPRRDGVRGRHFVGGSVLVLAGVLGMGTLVAQAAGGRLEREDWVRAGEAVRGEPRPDVERVVARLVIEPGRIRLDATLLLRDVTPERELLLSFNPGMTVEDVRVDGASVEHEHSFGLLRVHLPGGAESGSGVVRMALSAVGVPDPRFAYLDAVADPWAAGRGTSLRRVLGTEASVLSKSYVALLPGAKWLPLPGASFGDAPDRRIDFFVVDLEVETPRNWLVAGPGGRKESEHRASVSRFRFRPGTPVPEVAVIASNEFERRTAVVAGVEVELLLHRRHMRNVDYFHDVVRYLQVLAETGRHRLAGSGLVYPYGGISFVEVPARLRGYGGGSRMDTVLSAPGVAMIREHGFPTARFDSALEHISRMAEDLRARRLYSMLSRHMRSDFHGGAIAAAWRSNFLHFRTRARGPGASYFDLLLAELVSLELGGTGFFTPQLFPDSHVFGHRRGDFGAAALRAAMGDTAAVHNAVVEGVERPAVWERAGSVGPDGAVGEWGELGFSAARLHARTTARALFHSLNTEHRRQLFAELVRRHGGETFTADDFGSLVAGIHAPAGAVLAELLRLRSQPGYLVSPVEVVRLDDEEGRYLVRLHIRNDESAPGVVRLRLVAGQATHYSEVVRIGGREAVEIAMVVPDAPEVATLDTYLSRNLGTLIPELLPADAAPGSDPHAGVRPSVWRPRPVGLVIDDLDAGFAVLAATQGADVDRPDDAPSTVHRRLPAFRCDAPAQGWIRQVESTGWGKYRSTIACASSGKGGQRAVFTARLPSTGRWRLDYHIPGRFVRHRSGFPSVGRLWDGLRVRSAYGSTLPPLGRHHMALTAGAERFEISFDAAEAEQGWHLLGEYDLKSRDVRLAVSALSDGLVVADAIRWRKSPSDQGRVQARNREPGGEGP